MDSPDQDEQKLIDGARREIQRAGHPAEQVTGTPQIPRGDIEGVGGEVVGEGEYEEPNPVIDFVGRQVKAMGAGVTGESISVGAGDSDLSLATKRQMVAEKVKADANSDEAVEVG